MLNVVEIVLPVFLVVGIGYVVRRAGLVDNDFFAQVNKLVYYVCLPLLLVYKIGGGAEKWGHEKWGQEMGSSPLLTFNYFLPDCLQSAPFFFPVFNLHFARCTALFTEQ